MGHLSKTGKRGKNSRRERELIRKENRYVTKYRLLIKGETGPLIRSERDTYL